MIASKEITRYSLTALRIFKNNIMASDAKRLLLFRPKQLDEKDFPDETLASGDDKINVMIPRKDALALTSRIPAAKKDSELYEARFSVKLDNSEDKEAVRIATSDFYQTHKTIETIKQTEGNYPDVDGIFTSLEEKEIAASIVVNQILLSELLQHFALAKRFGAVRLTIYKGKDEDGDNNAMQLYSAQEEVGEMRGLIMPLTTEMPVKKYVPMIAEEKKETPKT